MLRTNSAAVIGLLYFNYDNKRQPDLSGYIATASAMVDQVVLDAQCLVPPFPISDTLAELIERWLSCYFYCKMDPLTSTRSTQGGSGSFVSNGSSLDGEADRYKRGAIEVDMSGCLDALLNRHRATAVLVGRRRRGPE